MVCIYDRKGFSYSKNFDKKMFSVLKKLVSILQDCYAERLFRIYVLDVNWVFKMLYAVVKPFLDVKTKAKICITTRSELQQYFDKD